jgi:hypothetical protein
VQGCGLTDFVNGHTFPEVNRQFTFVHPILPFRECYTLGSSVGSRSSTYYEGIKVSVTVDNQMKYSTLLLLAIFSILAGLSFAVEDCKIETARKVETARAEIVEEERNNNTNAVRYTDQLTFWHCYDNARDECGDITDSDEGISFTWFFIYVLLHYYKYKYIYFFDIFQNINARLCCTLL